uniref:RRM domain-containing protein n=1 Tax=Bos mutus grunniens TaxID=30521 RepID=A0A8B9XLJ5_BOSMU
QNIGNKTHRRAQHWRSTGCGGTLAEEEVRTLWVSGFPVDIKPRQLYLLFGPFKGYKGSLIMPTSRQPVGFVVFDCWAGAAAAKNALNGISHFIAGDTYNLMGAAPIPASPEAWAPYPLYTMELTPAISHTAVHLPSRHRCCCHPACSGVLVQFSPVQLLSRIRLFATPWTAALQASLSIPTPGAASNSHP